MQDGNYPLGVSGSHPYFNQPDVDETEGHTCGECAFCCFVVGTSRYVCVAGFNYDGRNEVEEIGFNDDSCGDFEYGD